MNLKPKDKIMTEKTKPLTKIYTAAKPRPGYRRDFYGDTLQRELDKSLAQRSKVGARRRQKKASLAS